LPKLSFALFPENLLDGPPLARFNQLIEIRKAPAEALRQLPSDRSLARAHESNQSHGKTSMGPRGRMRRNDFIHNLWQFRPLSEPI
jgi:hypothetical protein